jgi:xanthine dehydrogenase accessory factor
VRDLPELFARLRELLDEGKECVLATVVSRRGSGPREAGAMMLFDAAGPAAGTVGGGLLEARVSELARRVIEDGEPTLETFALDADAAAGEGMICGGTMEVLVSRLWPSPKKSVEVYRRALACLDRGESCRLVTLLGGDDGALRTAVGLLGSDGSLSGTLPVTAGKMETLFSGAGAGEPEMVSQGEGRFFVQPLRRPEQAFVFGAGHVSRALVPLLGRIGFFPVVVDDRIAFADPLLFPEAGAVVPVESFEGCVPALEIDGDSFVVIVTRGHLHDLEVAAQALGTPARYIGMIGSRRKKEGIFAALRGRGVPEEDLRRVRSPVGLSIGARTPEEIAVSIAAEMIAVRAGKGAGGKASPRNARDPE